MDKEKLLQQLEEKLLPSVQNLERQQAAEHDFFPALLWILLEKSKNSENLLKEIVSNNEESKKIQEQQLDKAANFILSKSHETNKATQEKTDELIENKISVISHKIEEIKTIQLKTEKKIFAGFLFFAIFQLITLSILAFIVMRPL